MQEVIDRYNPMSDTTITRGVLEDPKSAATESQERAISSLQLAHEFRRRLHVSPSLGQKDFAIGIKDVRRALAFVRTGRLLGSTPFSQRR